jgi:glycosyltransferase involved in cell wall biosynthesis
MEAFIKQGHSVFLLTQAPRGVYHEYSEKSGVRTFTWVIQSRGSFYFLRHAAYLVSFCKMYKIDVLYAHLENAGLPAVLAQYFMRASVFVCRHVIDEAYLMKSMKFILLNKIVYTLARRIIVVSEHCRNFMVEREKINPRKIQVIWLGYDFSLYNVADLDIVSRIRQENNAELLLITACRLVEAKRPGLVVELVGRLRQSGIDAGLLLLGTGPGEPELRKLIENKGLTEHVRMTGHVTNVQDYLAAADMLVHPSLQDSSSVIIKEAGLQSRPVLACRGIGDVDEYLVDRENAFLVSKDDTLNEMFEVILSVYQNKTLLSSAGNELNKIVRSRFDISNALERYNAIHAGIIKRYETD